jgi:RHS repeat-associated protein
LPKHYKIYDLISNVRAVVRDEVTGNYSIISQMDYEPFGAVLSQIGDSDRQTFIGKEKDYESSLGDFGVRKYDDFTGRFFQIDPLWEEYYEWTPYQYSGNSPTMITDKNGYYWTNNFSDGSETSFHIILMTLSPFGASMFAKIESYDFPVEASIGKLSGNRTGLTTIKFDKKEAVSDEALLFPKYTGLKVQSATIKLDNSKETYSVFSTPAHETWHVIQAAEDPDLYEYHDRTDMNRYWSMQSVHQGYKRKDKNRNTISDPGAIEIQFQVQKEIYQTIHFIFKSLP